MKLKKLSKVYNYLSETELRKNVEQVYRKLKDFDLSWDRKFSNLKIIFYFQTPICLSQPFIHFDSILLHRLLIDVLGKDYFYIHSVRLKIDEIFEKVLGVYEVGVKAPFDYFFDIPKVSAIAFDIPMSKLKQEVLYKRFEDKFYENGKIRTGMGVFRSFAEKYLYLPATKGVVYMRADKRIVEMLLKNLLAIGDDVRLGWGVIKRYEISEIDTDKSIIDTEAKMIMRVIPRDVAIEKLGITSNMTINYPYKPPYWSIDNVETCLVPFTSYEKV